MSGQEWRDQDEDADAAEAAERLAHAHGETHGASLWPHQQAMVAHAHEHAGAMWAADMGTGKSRAAIEYMRSLDWPRTLIVAPAAVVRGVWPQQFKRWADATVNIAVVDGSVKPTARINALTFADVVIVNYEMVWRSSFGESLIGLQAKGKGARFRPFALLVLDESHRIKSPGGKASRFLSRLADRIPRRLALTGTPMPHSPDDIYAQYRALDKRVFGTSHTLFKARYAVLGGFEGRQIVSWKNEAELRAKVASIAYTVKASDVLSLPPYVDTTLPVELGAEARRMAMMAETEFFLEVEGGLITITNALAKLLRLQQITSGFLPVPVEDAKGVVARFDNAKRDALISIFSDLGESHVVVFARFVADIDAIRDAAEHTGYRPFEVSGRAKELDEWREAGGVLAVQIQSGGVGIDLTAARTAIYYSLGFSLGDYLQSRARVHRPGQERSVHYLHLVASGTVDERVMQALDRRQQVVESILGGGAS